MAWAVLRVARIGAVGGMAALVGTIELARGHSTHGLGIPALGSSVFATVFLLLGSALMPPSDRAASFRVVRWWLLAMAAVGIWGAVLLRYD